MSNHSKKQYQIIVTGKVQRVGFRDKVDELADEFELTGYVENRRQKEVFILAQGEESNLIRFCDCIRECQPPVKIKNLSVTEHGYEGCYDEFFIKRGDPNEEIAERFDSAIYYLHKLDTGQQAMLGKQDQMLGKQDQMLNKQDQMLEKQDTIIHLQEDTLHEVKEMRTEFNRTFNNEVKELRSEVREVRNALIQAGVLKIADNISSM